MSVNDLRVQYNIHPGIYKAIRDRVFRCEGVKAPSCPIPKPIIDAALVARQVAQPIAMLGAQAQINVALGFAVMTGGLGATLWPVFALNLILFVLPYVALSWFAHCGDVGSALGAEIKVLDKNLRLVREMYESQGIIRQLPYAESLYDAAGTGRLFLVPLIAGRAPNQKEIDAGAAGMKPLGLNKAHLELAASAAQLIINVSPQAKADAEKRDRAIECIAEQANVAPNTATVKPDGSIVTPFGTITSSGAFVSRLPSGALTKDQVAQRLLSSVRPAGTAGSSSVRPAGTAGSDGLLLLTGALFVGGVLLFRR